MSEKVELELILQGGAKAVKTMGELEKALSDAREEIKGVEKGSEDFNRLATAIQQASSEVKTLEKQMEGLEPQQKAEAFLKMGEGIAGGFAVAQGALALAGVESEELEKIQVKVQAAISIAMGVRMMSEAALMAATAKRVAIEKLSMITTKANILLTKGAVAVQKLLKSSIGLTIKGLKGLKTAIASTGIGLLAVGVSSLISNFNKAGDSAKQLAKDLKEINDEINNIEETYNKEKKRRIDEINGVVQTSAQINVSAKQDEIDIVDKRIEQLKQEAEENKEYTDLQKAFGKNTTAVKLAYELLNKEGIVSIKQGQTYKGVLKDLVKEKKKLTEALLELEVTEISENNTSKKISKEKEEETKKEQERDEKRKRRREELKAQREKEAEELRTLEQELELLRIEDDNERAAAKIEQDRQIHLEKVANAENAREQILLINEKYDALELERFQTQLDKEQEEYDQYLKEHADKVSQQQQEESDRIKEARDKAVQDEIARQQKIADFKDSVGEQGFALAKKLGGKNEKLQKNLAIAETAFLTGKSIMRAVADIPAPFGLIQAGIHGAMGIAQIANIKSEKIGDASGGGGADITEPMLPASTGAFELGNIQQQPVKAFVVESEITDSQAQMADINRRSTI